MQFIQSKLFIKLLIIVSALGLLMIPVLASYKTFSKNSDKESNLLNMKKNPPTPETIQKTEEVEEFEYVYLKTAIPTQFSTSQPVIQNQNTVQNPTLTPRPTRWNERDEDDD